MWSELAISLQNGNVYNYLIIALSFIPLFMIVQRYIMLQFVYLIDFKKFIVALKKMIASEDLDRAINHCKRHGNTSLPYIARRAIEAHETDPTTIKGTIEEEAIDFLPRLEKWQTTLPAFAVVVLLLGVLGTIDSLWDAFHSIGVLDTTKKQAALSQGVASSLNNTALGLIMSMLILSGHYFIKALSIKVSERIHYGITVLNNLLVPHESAQFVPVDPGAFGAAPAPMEQDFSEEVSVTEDEDNSGEMDDGFDDVSVDDIQDEEEII